MVINNKYYGFRALIEIFFKKSCPNRNQNVSDDSFKKTNTNSPKSRQICEKTAQL